MLNPVIFMLPTRSPRKYRGKYPERVNSWSYSRSPSQQAIAEYLGISRPVHIELNNGKRYIADMKSIKGDDLKLSAELHDVIADHILETTFGPCWEELSQERYDEMLTLVQGCWGE